MTALVAFMGRDDETGKHAPLKRECPTGFAGSIPVPGMIWACELEGTMVLEGDCLEVMVSMEDESVDAIVTDPPYGLGFMGKEWDALPPGREWAEQCLRVLKPGGHLLAFGGSRTYHRLTVAIEDAGFEIRDQIMWLYGSGFPKSHNLPGGIGTALKPAHEPVVVARKPLAGTVAQNVERFGVGGLNVDGCRVGTEKVSTHSRGSNAAFPKRPGEKTAEESGRKKDQREGLAVGEERTGRWPANLVLDDVAGAMLDAQSGETKSTGGQASLGAFRNGDVYGKGRDERESRDPGFGDTGGASRFFYTAKASRAERNAGLDGFEANKGFRTQGAGRSPVLRCPEHGNSIPSGGTTYSCGCLKVWDGREGAPSAVRNHHPTVKPIDLMRWLVRLVTPPGGTVLDPFTGSGTTGVAAGLEGFDFIGIEREPEYREIAEARIEWWADKTGETADILAAHGLAEKARTEHAERGQLDLLGE